MLKKKKEKKDTANRTFILAAILYVLLGVILLIWHEPVTEIIGYIVAGGMLVIGGGYIFAYFMKDIENAMAGHDLVVGLLCVIAGIYIFLNVGTIINIIPTVLGFAVVFSGLLKVQKGIDAQRAGYDKWWIIMMTALVTSIIGIVILANPFKTVSTLLIVSGVGMIISGVSDEVVILLMGKIKRDSHNMEAEDEKK